MHKCAPNFHSSVFLKCWIHFWKKSHLHLISANLIYKPKPSKVLNQIWKCNEWKEQPSVLQSLEKIVIGKNWAEGTDGGCVSTGNIIKGDKKFMHMKETLRRCLDSTVTEGGLGMGFKVLRRACWVLQYRFWCMREVVRWTNLLREVLGAQEKSQQTSDNNGHHWEDEQAVLLTDPLHSHPHGVQRHSHCVSQASNYTRSSP